MKGLSISRQLYSHCRQTLSKSKFLQMESSRSLRPFKISVEGNIASGKSSFLKYFKQFPFVETYSEPLDKWRDVKGHNLLELLYEDMTKWNATFQSYVQLTRTKIQTSLPKEGVKIQMFERSVQNNRYCFMENAVNRGFILPAQYAVLCKWYEWIQENVDISLDLILYLRTNPDVAYKRVLSRSRVEEKAITLEYMESLHKAHEKWLMDPNQKIPVFVVDANKCFDEVIEMCQKHLPALFNQDFSSLQEWKKERDKQVKSGPSRFSKCTHHLRASINIIYFCPVYFVIF